MIDPTTLEFQGYLTGLVPGLRVLEVLDIDGQAWLLNELSQVEEHADRVDVYVMDPASISMVDQFNLERPFPKWAVRTDRDTVYIFHRAPFKRLYDAGYRSGVARLDLKTGTQSFIETPQRLSFKDMDVYDGTPCLTYTTVNGSDRDGLWCILDGEGLQKVIPQKHAVGIKFVPSYAG